MSVINRDQMEQWKNVTQGRVQVVKYDRAGALTAELVGPGRNVHLTPTEREINQEMAASPTLDVFNNGYLVPLRLLEGNESAKEIAANPEFLSRDDMVELLGGHWKTFEKRVSEIANPATLDRLHEVAMAENATVRQLEVISARRQQVAPTTFEEVTSSTPASAAIEGGLKPVTPS